VLLLRAALLHREAAHLDARVGYRTDKFTLRELAAKYGVIHQAIQKRATKEGWTKDLAKQIKHGTNRRAAHLDPWPVRRI